jgi:hypothetical protein
MNGCACGLSATSGLECIFVSIAALTLMWQIGWM